MHKFQILLNKTTFTHTKIYHKRPKNRCRINFSRFNRISSYNLVKMQKPSIWLFFFLLLHFCIQMGELQHSMDWTHVRNNLRKWDGGEEGASHRLCHLIRFWMSVFFESFGESVGPQHIRINNVCNHVYHGRALTNRCKQLVRKRQCDLNVISSNITNICYLID